MFNLGDSVLSLLEMVYGFWNNQVLSCFSLLSETPQDFKGGVPWGIVQNLNPIFVGVGSSLLVLFFVTGFLAESVDVREEMRFEVVLRLLIRLGIAGWLVSNNVTILKAIFQVAANLVGVVSAGTYTPLVISSEHADVMRGLSFGEGLVMLLIGGLLAIVTLICGFFLLYTVYFRVMKILVYVPLGSLAFATTAGNRMVSQSAVSYLKHVISTALEALTIALAISVCNAVVSVGLPDYAHAYSGWVQTLLYFCEMTFSVALTVGTVKGAQSVTGKALGL